jgi:hypothetical protein
MSRRSGSSLSIAKVDHGIEDKAATQKDSAIDKLFCSDFERMAKVRYSSAANKIATYKLSRLQNRTADLDTALR